MKIIKVLLVGLSDNIGGIEVFAKNLIMNSDPKKIQFTIMLEDNRVFPFQKELKSKGVKVVRFHSRKKGYRQYLNDIKTIYANGNFDIIHINIMSYSPFELIRYACKYSNGSVIVHSHWSGYKSGHYKNRLLHSIGKMLLKKCFFEKAACCIDAGVYMFGNQHFEVFYNGIDFNKYKYSKKNREAIRNELEINNTTYVVGDVALFTPFKNHDYLINVFAILKKRLSDAKLILVGVGPTLEKNRMLAKKLGIEEDVLFLGKRTDTEKIYSAMDVYVMPSSSEGLSIAICEAQISGLPCITSNGVTKESDISGNVRFLSLSDPNEWADAMLSGIEKRKCLTCMPEKFDINTTAKKIYNYYIDLVEKKES